MRSRRRPRGLARQQVRKQADGLLDKLCSLEPAVRDRAVPQTTICYRGCTVSFSVLKQELHTYVPATMPEDPDFDIFARDQARQPQLSEARRKRKASGEARVARDLDNTWHGRKCNLAHLPNTSRKNCSAVVQPVTIMCDNEAALTLVKHPIASARSKHIDVLHHFVRERVARGELVFKFCGSVANVADVFTKALPSVKFGFCKAGMGMVKL
ncbi:hypothetical protein QJQ45_001140 [Haematococcus lacustris]|nr:hypothetical protein QJQ45_001140 [Haematococcus lacustris]